MKMKRVVFVMATVVVMAFSALAVAQTAPEKEDKEPLIKILKEIKSAIETRGCKGDEEPPKRGCGQNCLKINQKELNDKLEQHKLWLKTKETKEEQGKQAIFRNINFKGLDLSNAILRETHFERCDLRKVKFLGSDLRGAEFNRSDLGKAIFGKLLSIKQSLGLPSLRKAIFTGSDLREVIFFSADLHEVEISLSDLREVSFHLSNLYKTQFIDSDLRDTGFIFSTSSKKGGAIFDRVKLKGSLLRIFNFENVLFEPEPGQTPEIHGLANATNLTKMTYERSPHGLVELRNAFKKYGMRQQEREMTFAIKHNERIKESGWLWNGFQYAFFEFPVGWGMYPERALFIMGGLIPFFTVFYYFPLGLGTWRGGTIWMRWREGRAANLGESGQPRPLKRRGWRRIAFAFYFSLLSAFHIGWRELNVGNWITRMQPREYTLQATGWPRVISGIQSLISVYLLALAILSYFGRPFE